MPKNIDMTRWRTVVADAKAAAKAAGKIAGDADIAATVSELLRHLDEDPIQRTTVSHWLTGRRIPNIAQYVALCHAVGIDPAIGIRMPTPGKRSVTELYAQDAARGTYRHGDEHIAKVVDLMEATDEGGRKAARAAVVVALNEQNTNTVRKKLP